jgi:hypothetical protein
MRMLLQFTARLSELLSFAISNIKIHLSHTDFANNFRAPQYMIHNLESVTKYETLLSQFIPHNSTSAQVAISERLPHYRYFEFKSIDLTFHITILR